ncbi:MAG: GGDEF domain-containing protein [Chloroflexi bacterium]|nr:GGDEF domain-containing protein [Chloroflexota bacterium]
MKTEKETITSASPPDTKLIGRLIAAQSVCFAIVGIIATIVLFGWLVPAIGSMLPSGWPLMKANTALNFLLSVAGLALTQPKQSNRRTLVSRGCGVIVMVLAGSALFAHLSGHTLGLETLLAPDRGAEMPGWMSIQTASFFVLVGLILAFGEGLPGSWKYVIAALTIASIILTLMITAGYVFGATNLVGQSPFTRTSPLTLICMVPLVFTLVIRRMQMEPFSVLVGMGIGSHIARVAMPFALILPILAVGIGAYAIFAGWLSVPYAMAFTTLTISFLLLAFVVLMARRINSLERDLRELSLTDELTKTYNRRGLYLLGEYALREGRRTATPLTVLYFDLDGLKEINDSLGHEIGSQLLLDFANLLSTTFRTNDVVARLGGDEFVVVGLEQKAGLMAGLQRLADATTAMNNTADKPYYIRYSFGKVIGDPASDETFDELMARADAAMYEHKRIRKSSRMAEEVSQH